MSTLADALDAALPQTQCTRCGFPDCRSYAVAIADGTAEINRCPPGGQVGVARLAALSGRPVQVLDAACGSESPRHRAIIDEDACIGCTRCLPVCPVDCIVGGPKSMHTVIDRLCTGCALCVPACPVDCIALVPVSGDLTGWRAWSEALAAQARGRHDDHRARHRRDALEHAARLAAAPHGMPGGPDAASDGSPAEALAPPPLAAAAVAPAAPALSTDAASVSAAARDAAIEAALRRAREARRVRR